MRKLLKKYAFAPERLVTDDLRSYSAAARELGIERRHERLQWKNNRAENSYQPTRRRERQMQRISRARDSGTRPITNQTSIIGEEVARQSVSQSKCEPPFISITSPVMNPASGDARNEIAWATSSGLQNRPTGIWAN
jgi:DDE domain